MTPHPVFLVGAGICVVSFLTLFVLVASKGGLSKSKQIGTLMALFRGEHGKPSKRLTVGSFVGLGLGMLCIFAGVAANDVAQENRCQARCLEAGHTRGKIGPSVEMSMTRRNSAAFLACTCTGGVGAALELHADEL